jgi:hypothetical protein
MGKQDLPPDTSTLLLTLQRLWKGTLYVGIAAVYLCLIAVLLIEHGWTSALLAVFLIGLGQFFRYIENDVDRIGWVARTKEVQGDVEEVRRYQATIRRVLAVVIQGWNLAVVFEVYWVAGWETAAGGALGLLAIEVLYGRIRAVNRRIEFQPVRYGFREDLAGENRPDGLNPHEYRGRGPALEEKLEQLRNMAQRGEISQKAYEDRRDYELVKRVMESTEN